MLIFVNYRTSDQPFAAALIDKALTQHFGPDETFFDSRSIRPGMHFPPEIWRALLSCRVFLAVIGPRWLDRLPDGRRPIDHPGDYVRREIAVALRRDILVVPVLIGDARLPAARVLPADIAGLASRQYLHLRVRNAEYDLMRLVDELMELVGGVTVHRRRAPRGGRPEQANVSNNFHGPVDARGAVFGTVNGRS